MTDLIEELRHHEQDYPSLIHGPLCGLAADEIERLRKALEEINSQAVCACIARQDECFQMLQNCAEISDTALAVSSTHLGAPK